MRLPTLSFSGFHTSTSLGLDLSDRAAKFFQLRRNRHNYDADLFFERPLPAGIIKNGIIIQKEQLVQELNQCLRPSMKKLSDIVVLSLPDAQTFLRTISIEKPGELPDRLLATLPQYLPLPIAEMYYDHVVMGENDQGWQVTIASAARSTVDAYLDVMEALHLIPVALEVQALALARFALAEKSDDHATAILDLGGTRSSLIVCDRGTVQFTVSLPIAGDDITQRIAEQLSLNNTEAEKAKRTCGLDAVKCDGALRVVLTDMVDRLTDRIHEAQEYYLDHFPEGRNFAEIIVAGGGAELLGIDEVLQQKLNIPVKRPDGFQRWKIEGKLPEAPLRFATTTGLALRTMISSI